LTFLLDFFAIDFIAHFVGIGEAVILSELAKHIRFTNRRFNENLLTGKGLFFNGAGHFDFFRSLKQEFLGQT